MLAMGWHVINSCCATSSVWESAANPIILPLNVHHNDTGPVEWSVLRIKKYGVAEEVVNEDREGSVGQWWNEQVHRI